MGGERGGGNELELILAASFLPCPANLCLTENKAKLPILTLPSLAPVFAPTLNLSTYWFSEI